MLQGKYWILLCGDIDVWDVGSIRKYVPTQWEPTDNEQNWKSLSQQSKEVS